MKVVLPFVLMLVAMVLSWSEAKMPRSRDALPCDATDTCLDDGPETHSFGDEPGASRFGDGPEASRFDGPRAHRLGDGPEASRFDEPRAPRFGDRPRAPRHDGPEAPRARFDGPGATRFDAETVRKYLRVLDALKK